MRIKDKGFGSVAELTANNFEADQIFQFWLLKRTDNSSYSEDKRGRTVKIAFPASYPIKLEEQVSIINKETGRLESNIIRHCIGEQEIFKHLQSPDDKIKKIVTQLNFVQGHKNVMGSDTTILKYLSLSNFNASNPNRDTRVTPLFFLHDGNVQIEKAMEHEDDLFETQAFIRNPENLDLLLAYARVILPQPEFDKIYGKPDHIVYKMLGLAKGNPKLFRQGLENPATLKKHYILEAIDEKLIIFNQVNNAIYFKSGELIQQAPIGLSPINVFVDKVSEDRTGNAEVIYRQILKMMHKDKPKAKATEVSVEEEKEVEEPVRTSIGLEAEMKELADKAISKGVIIREGKTTFVHNKGTASERNFLGFKGARGLVTALSNEPTFCQKIKSEIGI